MFLKVTQMKTWRDQLDECEDAGEMRALAVLLIEMFELQGDVVLLGPIVPKVVCVPLDPAEALFSAAQAYADTLHPSRELRVSVVDKEGK
jgi:hypothetical protein